VTDGTAFEHPRNAAAEAGGLVGPQYEVRVLEPSPPAAGPPDFSDDPAWPDGPGRPRGPFRSTDSTRSGDRDPSGSPDRLLVTPTSAGDLCWDDLAAERPELADYVRTHWLGNYAALRALPDDYPRSRDDYHRLAYAVVAEARRLANGRFGLRYTRGGFGTPFFGSDEQVRVEGVFLVHQTRGGIRRHRITTLRAAAAALGIEPGDSAAEHDSPPLGDIDAPLRVSEPVGAFLGEWFGFAFAALEELRLTPGAHDPERTQLWPGHFDPAIAMGDPEAAARATYGASPGDAVHPDPYVYVGAWESVDSDPFWNAEAFSGALLGYESLATAPDPVAAAVAFFGEGHRRLTSR